MKYNPKHRFSLHETQIDALQIYGKYNLDKSIIWMTEEFGELIQAIRKNKSKDCITAELGDLLAWVFCIANILDLDVKQAICLTFTKEINRQFLTYGKLKYCENECKQNQFLNQYNTSE